MQLIFISYGRSPAALLCVMKIRVLKLVASLLLSVTSVAQVRNTPPHDGQLKRAGYYNMEVLDCSGYLEIYLYDLNMSPIRNSGLSGWVDFHYPDSTCATSRLYHYSIDGFTAEPERQLYSSCEVFIRGVGVSVQMTFKDLVCIRRDE